MRSHPTIRRIGVVASSVSHLGGGVAEAVRGQSVALARRGVEVLVFAPSDGGDLVEPDRWEGVEIRTRYSPLPKIGLLPDLKRALVEADVGLVHLHGLWNFVSVSVSAWGRSTRRPVIISPHGMLDPWAVSRSSLKKRIAAAAFETQNIRGATCLHALNEQEVSGIRAFGVLSPIAVIPNGVDPPPSREAPAPTFATRKKMLFLGRLHEKKGLMETLEAWALFKNGAPEVAERWSLIIAGWGEDSYATDLQQKSRALGLCSDVHFVGRVHGEDKSQALGSADAFVLASKSEGLPIAVLEAWSYGLPVFMTDEVT